MALVRLDEAMRICFHVSGPTAGVTAMPLILVAFLGDAFRHGVASSGAGGGDPWIEFARDAPPGGILFSVCHSKVMEVEKTVAEASSIRLAGACRRLELAYPAQYKLPVSDTEDKSEVPLKLSAQ